MAGRPIRRQRLASEAARRAAEASRSQGGGQILRVLGTILLATLMLLYAITFGMMLALRWCGTNLAARLDLEDLLDRMPGVAYDD